MKVVQHGVKNVLILRPTPLQIDEPGHGHDPTNTGYLLDLILQDDLCIMVGSGMMESHPEEVPVQSEM